MTELFTPKVLLLGFLSWLIPFVVSFAFFGPGGILWIAQPLFKSIMVLVGGASGIWLLWLAFRRVTPAGTSGLSIGLLWMAINLVLDIVILIPMSGMGLPLYFMDIGLRYLLLPMIAWAMGVMAERSRASL